MTIINRKKSGTVVKIQLTSMSILKIEKIKSIIQKTIIRTLEVIVAFLSLENSLGSAFLWYKIWCMYLLKINTILTVMYLPVKAHFV